MRLVDSPVELILAGEAVSCLDLALIMPGDRIMQGSGGFAEAEPL